MPTWKVTLEYEGTRYRGWQSQKNTDRTIQGVLTRAARELLGEDATVGGAGRTDAGVHAHGQVAHLRARRALTELEIEHGLNDKLPFDINVLRVSPAPPSFHARHDASSRLYLYRISRRRTAFEKRLVWWVRDQLDADAMEKGAGLVRGRHDFASFCENAEGQESTVLIVDKSEIFELGSEIHYRIGSSHFLWKMVRRIVGALVQVGRGDLAPADLERLLQTRSADPAKWTAPPSGLFLEKVNYDGPPATPLHQPRPGSVQTRAGVSRRTKSGKPGPIS